MQNKSSHSSANALPLSAPLPAPPDTADELAPTIFLVDDDEDVRESLSEGIKMSGLSVQSFASAEAFLESYRPGQHGCLVLDIRMQGMDGLALQENLAGGSGALPIIFITGHGTVSNSVRAIKAGAIDVLEKPFPLKVLLQRIEEALEEGQRLWRRQAEQAEIRARFERLTPREREVMANIVAGTANHSNKEIAIQLDISYRTVEHHRLRVMEKMQAESVAELVLMATLCGIREPHRE